MPSRRLTNGDAFRDLHNEKKGRIASRATRRKVVPRYPHARPGPALAGLFFVQVTFFVAGKTQSNFLRRSLEPTPAVQIASLRKREPFPSAPSSLAPLRRGFFCLSACRRTMARCRPTLRAEDVEALTLQLSVRRLSGVGRQ